MGCWLSKIDSKLMKLCKERKELIKATKYCQCSLAFAHLAYFQTLQDVGNEFRNFMEEALVICQNSPFDTFSDQPFIEEVPQSEGSTSEYDEEEEEEEEDSTLSKSQSKNDNKELSDSKAINSKTVYKGVPGEVVYQTRVAAPKNVPKHYATPSITAQPPQGNLVGSLNPGSFRFPQSEIMGFRSSGFPVTPPYRKGSFIGQSDYDNTSSFANYRSGMPSNEGINLPVHNFRLSQNKSTTPVNNFMDNFPDRLRSNVNDNRASFRRQNDFPSMALSFFQHQNRAQENYLMDFPPNNPWDYQRQSSPHNDLSTWDYLNPFNLVEHTYNTAFGDIDLLEVREREGIPDLEDISDDEISSDEDLELNEDEISDKCCCEAIHVQNVNKVNLDQDKEFKTAGDYELMNVRNEKNYGFDQKLERKPNCSTTTVETEKLETGQTQEDLIQKEMERLETSERIDKPSQTNETVAEATSQVLVHCSTDIQEVYNKIKNEFDNIIMHGKYVSAMLETDKLHHQPGITLFRGFCCIQTSTASSKALSSSKRSAYRILKRETDGSENHEETNNTSRNLLMTLEKLHIWESKLYEEVKSEEKLRLNLEKEWRRLKKLYDNGAEPPKIDASQLCIRKLTPRINVVISKVDRIAREIHKVRDEELHPQLCELVCRIRQMFKFSLECHKKQVQAIMEAKATVEVCCMTSNLSLKVTQKLEAEILKLGTTFSNWIKTHKAFVVLLKGWLMKGRLEEPEVTTSENSPFSCSNLGAPTIVTICHDWFKAVEKASDIEVLGAINSFATLLHKLQKKLLEERQQRVKLQNYARSHEKKLEMFSRECSERGLDWNQGEALFNEVHAVDSIEIKDLSLNTMHTNLISTRNRLDEAKVNHEEVIKQVNDIATIIFQNGFLPVFKALESFNMEMLNAFLQVRIPNEGNMH